MGWLGRANAEEPLNPFTHPIPPESLLDSVEILGQIDETKDGSDRLVMDCPAIVFDHDLVTIQLFLDEI
jgi:hypothetical protein